MQHAKLLIIPFIIIAAAAGTFGVYSYNHAFAPVGSENQIINKSDQAGRRVSLRPDINMPDNTGKSRSLKEWDGKLLFINFWAPWCDPCRKEIPHFIELQEQFGDHGLQFIGIALDRPEEVRFFMESTQFNYPILIGEREGYRLAKLYGNKMAALPYTVVVDREGRIVFTRKGELFKHEVEKLIAEWL